MKTFLLSILSFLFYSSGYCQSQSIPKTYHYFSEKEEWRLTTFDFKNFELRVKKTDENYFRVVDGNCLLTDSTIQLAFNSSVNLDIIKKDSSYGPNIKELIKRAAFKRLNDYIFPKTPSSTGKYRNILNSYFQQFELNMGGTKITFDNKKRYSLIDYFCTGKYIEKGQYFQSGNIINLKPNKKSISRSSFLMDNNVLFATEEFLISRKIQPSMEPDKFAKEEVFLYFFRM